MSDDLWGVHGLDLQCVLDLVPLLSEEQREAVADAQRRYADNVPELVRFLSRYKRRLLSFLGVEVAVTEAEAATLDLVAEYLGARQEFPTVATAVQVAEGNNPEGFYLWVKSTKHPEEGLQRLVEQYGECSPELAMCLLDAPEEVPLSIYLLHPVNDGSMVAPEVPEDFLDNYPSLAAQTDVPEAIIEAYVRATLQAVFTGSRSADIRNACVSRRGEDLLRAFPMLVWRLSGRKLNKVEQTIF